MQTNHLKHSKVNPYHLSVGAVLLDNEDNVVCHYFKRSPKKAPGEYKDIQEVYMLMRETPKEGETTSETLARGLLEELGATGEEIAFLGSNEHVFVGNEYKIQKTTIYFLVRMTSLDTSLRDHEDIESESEVVHLPIDVCIQKMKDQYERLKIPTLNESLMVERAKEFLIS